jgi:hypothetical protein
VFVVEKPSIKIIVTLVERAGFDKDPEDIETGFADAIPSRVISDGFPESIADHQRCFKLRCYREAPCRNQPVVDPREKDGFGRGGVREIDEASIAAGEWCTKMIRPSSQARNGIPDLPAVAIQSTT